MLAIMLLGIVTLAWSTRRRWRAWWRTAAPAQRALVLCSALAMAEVAFGAAFWVTRNQTYAAMGWLPTLFSLSTEWRPPTFFATAQWWLAGWLAAHCRRLSGHGIWGVVAAACVFLGADELLSLHELVGATLRQSGWLAPRGAPSVDLGPINTFFWPIVYVPLAGGFGLFGLWGLSSVLRRGRLVDQRPRCDEPADRRIPRVARGYPRGGCVGARVLAALCAITAMRVRSDTEQNCLLVWVSKPCCT